MLFDDEFVADLAIHIMRAIDETVAIDLDVQDLISRELGKAHLRVVVRRLLVMLRAGDGDDIDGPFPSAGNPVLCVHGIGPQVGVVMPDVAPVGGEAPARR